MQPREVANFHRALRDAFHATTRLGYSKLGKYASAWQHAYAHPEGVLPTESNAMWTDKRVPFSVVRLTVKARLCLLWNAKVAKMYGMAY